MIPLLDLFSGIGGFSLGLEATGGFRTVAFCETDPYARAVLRRHWPGVPVFDDVRVLNWRMLRDSCTDFPLALAGGFPCQDISAAGAGAGLAGERSGLWREYARLIGEVRPYYAVVENVAALRSRGLDTVLGDLAALGYDAEWHSIPASAVGAPHRRDRVWIIAYSNQHPRLKRRLGDAREGAYGRDAGESSLGDVLADATGTEFKEFRPESDWLEGGSSDACSGVSHPDGESLVRSAVTWSERGPWTVEPDVGRVVDGISSHMDRLGGIPLAAAPSPDPLRSRAARTHRLRGLGNAIVPRIATMIGNAILAAEGM